MLVVRSDVGKTMTHKSMSAAFESLFRIRPFKREPSKQVQKAKDLRVNAHADLANASQYREAQVKNDAIHGVFHSLGRG